MMTKPDYSIQQMSTLTGLTEHTLRYYERAGLLTEVQRGENGHRRYSEGDVRRIEMINRLRQTGMPIREIRRYTDLVAQGESTYAERMALLENHERRVEAFLRETLDNLEAIKTKITFYREKEAQREAACVR